jgi:protein associated with RNAse G/E
VPREGDRVEVRFTKWGGGRHWEFPLRCLGADEHGVWGAGETGTRLWRPGVELAAEHPWVTLFPHDASWAASFYDSPDQPTATYVDMTTVPEWTGRTVAMVDLDLDVVLGRDGSLLLDDEDEFEVHRVELGYPEEVVDLARRAADEVMAAIWDGTEPFGSVGGTWVARARER